MLKYTLNGRGSKEKRREDEIKISVKFYVKHKFKFVSIFGPRLLWPNGCMDQDATWSGSTQHCVRCGPKYPQKKGIPTPHNFGPCLLWPNGWMDEDAAWYGSRPQPRPQCTRRGPSSRERGTGAPSFRPMSLVATVAHLSYC